MKSMGGAAKTSTQRAQSLKARRKDAGLVRLELWVKADAIKAIKAFAALVQTAIHTNAQ